tara:strand:+ start:81 stop:773 length:693 start_codon:yes stop_codon:yes gene_type:complete
MKYCDTSRVIIKKSKKDDTGVYDIITNKHYAKTWTASQHIYAIYWDTQEEHSFFEDTKIKLIGAVLYGNPVGSRVVKSISEELENGDVLELKRLWVEDGYGKNIESYIISQTLKKLKKDNPDAKVVISYADPGVNHKGIIYRATNWLYQGSEIGIGDSYMYQYPSSDVWLSDRAMSNRIGTNGLRAVLKIIPDMKYKRKLRKYRYLYFLCSKKDKKHLIKNLKHPLLDYE